jgi:hypothetical protein
LLTFQCNRAVTRLLLNTSSLAILSKEVIHHRVIHQRPLTKDIARRVQLVSIHKEPIHLHLQAALNTATTLRKETSEPLVPIHHTLESREQMALMLHQLTKGLHLTQPISIFNPVIRDMESLLIRMPYQLKETSEG